MAAIVFYELGMSLEKGEIKDVQEYSREPAIIRQLHSLSLVVVQVYPPFAFWHINDLIIRLLRRAKQVFGSRNDTVESGIYPLLTDFRPPLKYRRRGWLL